MGKAIYKPVGKAGEYARWACNYFLGCSNDCDYCYCKQGVLGTVAGGNEPRLKACFRDEKHAFSVFVDEVTAKADVIRKEGGLFFSFTSDPCLPQTVDLTVMSVMFATGLEIPCQILTKCVDWLLDEDIFKSLMRVRNKVSIGFTLTGMDKMERGVTIASNRARIAALKRLHENGFKTFVSLEPVISIERSVRIFSEAADYVDLLKVGLLSGRRDYGREQVVQLVTFINSVCEEKNVPVYWKRSVNNVYGKKVEGPMCVDENFR